MEYKRAHRDKSNYELQKHENKTKYTQLSRRPTLLYNFSLGQFSFGLDENFKYLSVIINYK